VLFVTLGSVTYGYSSSIIGTTLGQPSFIEYFNLQSVDRSAAITGAINGLYQAGGLFGTLSTTLLADRLGRRKTIVCGSFFVVIGGALQTGSIHIAMFMVARFLTGIGIGKLQAWRYSFRNRANSDPVGNLVTIVPLWQGEVAPPAARGFLVGLHGNCSTAFL
jgi:MFS family permease